VIYLPPFYLLHTPGLFEGRVFAAIPEHVGLEERSTPPAEPAKATVQEPVKARRMKQD